MDQWKFGDILRQTRERKGLSFAETANRLRIRPDLLRAIEESNIAAMPPSGYARNMVTGYARFLGLNPQELGSMYLEELQLYEERRERVRARQNGEADDLVQYRNDHMTTRPAEQRTSEVRSGSASPYRSASRQREQAAGGGRTERLERVQRTERNRSVDVDDSAHRPRRQPARQSADSQRANPLRTAVGAVSSAAESVTGSRRRPSFNTSGRGRQARDPMLHANDYVGFLQGSRAGQSKLPYILAAIIILLVLILIAVFAFGGNGSKKEQEVTTLPVNTVEETVQEQAKKAPTSFTFGYEVDEGAESWIEVYVDDELQVGEVVTGPASGTYDITGKVQFVSARSDGVHVTVDGQEQELQFDDNGSVNMTFEFSDFLSQWQKENGVADTSGASSSSQSDSTSSTFDSTAEGSSDASAGDASADASAS